MADLKAKIILLLEDRFSASFGKVAASVAKLEEAKRKAAASFQVAANLRQAGDASVRVGQRILGVVGSMTSAASDFEQMITRVKALGDDYGEEGMRAISDEALRLGSTTSFTAVQAAEAFANLAQDGFSVKASIASMQPILDMAAANMMDVGSASAIAISYLRQFGVDAENPREVAKSIDILSRVSTATATDVGELGYAMQYAATTAKALGVSQQDMGALAGMLANVGLKGSMAGTSLRGIMQRMTDLKGAGAKAFRGFADGMTGARWGAMSLVEQLTFVGQKTRDLDPQARVAAFGRLFGARAMAGMAGLAPLLESGKFDELLEKLKTSEGATRSQAALMLDTTAGATIKLESALEGLRIQLGMSLLPLVRLAAEGLATVSARVQAISRRFPRLTKFVLGATVAAGAFALVLGSALLVGSMALSSMALVKLAGGYAGVALAARGFAIPAILAAGKALLAFAANPVVLAVVAIVAAGVAIYKLVKHWDAAQARLAGIWARLRDSSTSTKIVLGLMLAPIAVLLGPLSALAGLVMLIAANFDALKSAAVSAVEAIVGAFAALKQSKAWRYLVAAPAATVVSAARSLGVDLPDASPLRAARETMAEIKHIISPTAQAKAQHLDVSIAFDASGMPVARVTDSSGAVRASARALKVVGDTGLAFGALY